MSDPKNANDFEVIGIVKDMKSRSLLQPDHDVLDYLPVRQRDGYMNDFEVRYTGDFGAIAATVQRTLGPTFHRATVETKIIVYDHNCDRPDYPLTILSDPDARQYVTGSAFHLYGGQITALSKVHDGYPNKNVYFT
jgi:O-glycosyl hydrolase